MSAVVVQRHIVSESGYGYDYWSAFCKKCGFKSNETSDRNEASGWADRHACSVKEGARTR